MSNLQLGHEYNAVHTIECPTKDGIVRISMAVNADSDMTREQFAEKWAPILVEGCKPE